jgi:hypothetical protein
MIDLRYFNFCPMMQTSVLGLVCHDCQYLAGNENNHRCDYQSQPGEEGYAVRDVIARLLDCLEEGRLSLSKDELLLLLED